MYEYTTTYLFFFFINLFILFILFLAALGLRCCAQAFSSCSERGLLFVVLHRLLIAVASLVAEHRLIIAVASLVAEHRLQAHGLQ